MSVAEKGFYREREMKKQSVDRKQKMSVHILNSVERWSSKESKTEQSESKTDQRQEINGIVF